MPRIGSQRLRTQTNASGSDPPRTFYGHIPPALPAKRPPHNPHYNHHHLHFIDLPTTTLHPSSVPTLQHGCQVLTRPHHLIIFILK